MSALGARVPSPEPPTTPMSARALMYPAAQEAVLALSVKVTPALAWGWIPRARANMTNSSSRET